LEVSNSHQRLSHPFYFEEMPIANSEAENGLHSETARKGDWSPPSWRSKPVKQEVVYADRAAADASIKKLETLPPIVTPLEIVKLRHALRDVALGKAFLLQGGDCAELFSYCESEAIDSKIKLLLQMSLVLIWGSNKPVVRIARMAGQYAKPRSSPMEKTSDGRQIPSFRGDILNGFKPENRDVRPERLVDAYMHSAATLNWVRAQLASGIADLNNPLDWGLGHVRDPELQGKYHRIVSSITDSLRFMHTVGADAAGQLHTVDLYTSHEGLVLEYEQALTRRLRHPPNYYTPTQQEARLRRRSSLPVEGDGKGWYNVSAHFVWIGDRTRQLDGGHVEFFRGLENPIGIKVGPTMESDELVRLLDIVNPERVIGKVTLITRYGENNVEGCLGKHIEAVKGGGHTVVWQCDPMHG
jgi:3-deoxy-7-phosphoheptulonate synthase